LSPCSSSFICSCVAAASFSRSDLPLPWSASNCFATTSRQVIKNNHKTSCSSKYKNSAYWKRLIEFQDHSRDHLHILVIVKDILLPGSVGPIDVFMQSIRSHRRQTWCLHTGYFWVLLWLLDLYWIRSGALRRCVGH
jgi:hypothetical protein